jgi:LysR family glycine cleavage system transcriptional activator
MRKLPPLIQLKAFEAAARHLSFKEAAMELHVSPTAISHQIRKLEDYCECSLFRRRPRPLALTRAGEALFPVFESGLDKFSRALESAKGYRDPEKVTLTTTSSFGNKWLIPRLSDWRKSFPSLSLEVIATDAIVDLHVEADLAIRYMNAPPYSPELLNRELIRDEFIAVSSPDLIQNGEKFKSLKDLSECTLVYTPWSAEDLTAPTWERWFRLASSYYGEQVDISHAQNLTFHEETQAIDAALCGAGILIVSDFLVARELALGTLVKVIDFTLPGYGFYLSYRKDHPHCMIFEKFDSWIRESIANANAKSA